MGEYTDHPLRLTSPERRGQPVKDAQWLMLGHNRFADTKHPVVTYHGKIDGVFGQGSATGSKQAHFELGYPAWWIAKHPYMFGQDIYDYLTHKPLPALFQHNRAARIKAAELSIGAKALNYAKGFDGYKEVPRNHTMFGRWYGLDGEPWCAIFDSYCMAHVGSHFRYSYVPAIVDNARWGHGMHFVSTPEYGDLGTYYINGVANEHVAFFDHFIDSGHTHFKDFGGNTGPINISNGGMVIGQIRPTTMVAHWIRVTA